MFSENGKLPNEAAGSGKIRVLIADDHELIRDALRGVVDAEPDMQVVGEAQDGEQAVAMATQFHPDVVLMDIEMPKLSGIAATERIKSLVPDVLVLVLTIHDSAEYILQVLEAGASAYITKAVVTRDIPVAIRCALGRWTPDLGQAGGDL